MSDAFVDGFDFEVETLSGSTGSVVGSDYVGKLQQAIESADNALRAMGRANIDKGIDYLKGDIAEVWHAETLKIDAVRLGDKSIFAAVPRDRSHIDIRYGNRSNESIAQLKYYKSASDTARQISQPKYGGMDQKIVPSDQLDGVRDEANRLYQKSLNSRPHQAQQYGDTRSKASDRLKVEKAQSTPLSEPEARQLASDLKSGEFDPRRYGLETKSVLSWSDVAQKSGEAAVSAAVMGAVLRAVPKFAALIKNCVSEGYVDPHGLTDATTSIAAEVPWDALRGGVAAFLTVSCESGLFGESLAAISPDFIGVGTVVAINAVRNAIELAQGNIDGAEFAYRSLHDTCVCAFGVLGGIAGQVIIPVPVLGALLGNVLGGVIGHIVWSATDSLILGLAIKQGWTFFDFVTQDYTVPQHVLKRAGFDVFPMQSFLTSSFPTSGFPVSSFETNSIDITPVKRGLIGVRTVGYIHKR